jgi:hypothetical protein
MSDKNLEQRINIKFYEKLGEITGETLALLTLAYDEYSIKKSSVFEWHRRFKENVRDDPKSGQTKTPWTDGNVDSVASFVLSDRRLSVKLIAEGYGNLFGRKY